MICGLALHPIQNPGYAYALNHVQYAYQILYQSLHLSIVGAPSRAVADNIAKVQSNNTLYCFQSKISLVWKIWNGIWKKILAWNGIWKKILGWNGRFLVWNKNGMKENCQYGI